MLKGIDISNWQGKQKIDLKSVIRKNKLDFVIVKATEGMYFVDGYCDTFIQAAEAAGCSLIGFYHFADPRNDPVKEADYFLTHTAGYLGRYIPILDLETVAGTPEAWAYKFISRCKDKTGITPWLYSYLAYLNRYDFQAVKSLDVGFWIAEYKSSANINGFPEKAPAYTKPKGDLPICAYQFTSKGRLINYNANLDLDYFYGTAEHWMKYAEPKGKDPGVIMHQQLIDQIADQVISGKWGTGETRKKALGLIYEEVQKAVNKKAKETK